MHFFTLDFCHQELQVPAVVHVQYGTGYMKDAKQAAGDEESRSFSFPCALSSRVGNYRLHCFSEL